MASPAKMELSLQKRVLPYPATIGGRIGIAIPKNGRAHRMLFVRTPKGMRLTREGKELRDQAVRALSVINTIRDRAGALKDEAGISVDVDRF